MRFLTSFIFVLFFAISSTVSSQTSEMFNGHIINRTDKDGLKQGKWVVFNSDKSIVLEEIEYVDNKKNGTGIKYYPNGKIKQELTYVDNKANGYAKMYYENGNVSEEGIWKNNKWVGEYKFYFESGNLAYEWSYSETGKRTGTQKYYHENGQVMIEGDWNEGKESGILREYDEKGNLVQEKNYVNGELDKKSVKTYGPDAKPNTEKPVIKYEKPEDIAVKKDTIKHKPTQNSGSLDLFTGTGYSKLFTKTGQVEQEGYSNYEQNEILIYIFCKRSFTRW